MIELLNLILNLAAKPIGNDNNRYFGFLLFAALVLAIFALWWVAAHRI
ncbi:MAG: hypothetical protein JWR19_4307 [Pedosphaera sp.]|nr:hypothetical protein [Pedosphaera sp.]